MAIIKIHSHQQRRNHMFNRVRISLEEINKVLSAEESHFLDMKSALIKPSRLSHTLSALANADGGEVFIGVNEDKNLKRFQWEGFPSIEAANQHIEILDSLFPMGHHCTCEFLRPSRNGNDFPGHVLHITVQKTPDIVYATNGNAYVRRNAQNLSVDIDGLERLKRNKGIISFESRTIATSTDSVTNSEAIIAFMLEVIPMADPSDWLKKQGLIVSDMPTVAALLLFSDEPQIALPKRSAIKIYRYRTDDAEGDRDNLDGLPNTIEGCIYEQVRQAVEKTVEIIHNVRVRGTTEAGQLEYPRTTLHEIITNAVLHRDYAIADDVHVRIFDNRIEVESPGKLPGHITAENILRERFARNGTIVRLINKFPDPPNKDVGEGLNAAFAAMKQLQLKDPIITENENSVLVTINHQRLASPEQVIIEYLETSSNITNQIARDLTGIRSEGSITRTFKRLQAEGVIEPVPGRVGSRFAWRTCKKTNQPTSA